MAGNKTAYLSDLLLNWIKGTTFPAAPANTYVGLFTTMPVYAGTGGVEVSGGAYARATEAAAGWSVISTGANGDQIDNTATLTYPTPTAGWGTVLGFGIFDALTGGNLLYFAILTGGSKVINSGDTVSWAGGALIVADD